MVQTLIIESEAFMNKEITEERIEEVVNNAFIEKAGDIALDFANNIKLYEEALSEFEGLNGFDMFFAAIQTAQDTCLEVLKVTLKELLCD